MDIALYFDIIKNLEKSAMTITKPAAADQAGLHAPKKLAEKIMIKKAVLTLTLLISFAFDAYGAELFVPDQHRTIQEALDLAAPGDIVTVKPGSYSENIVIKRLVTLRSSDGPASTAINAAKKDEPVISINDAIGVAIEGLSATGSEVAGIRLTRSSSVTLKGNHATNNLYGIALYDSSDNKVENNTADLNENYGIYLEKSHRNTVVKNSASSNGDRGIFISASDSNTVIGNTANLNTWNGIVLWSAKSNIIRGNKTLRNTYGLVLTESSGNTVDENTSLPNVFIILPILLIYLGILLYLIQKYALKFIYRS